MVVDPRGTGHAAKIEGTRVAGKTGTTPSGADAHYSSFVGIASAKAPRVVVLVRLDGVTGSGDKQRSRSALAR